MKSMNFRLAKAEDLTSLAEMRWRWRVDEDGTQALTSRIWSLLSCGQQRSASAFMNAPDFALKQSRSWNCC
jgi:hypothetical protein